MTTNPNNTVNSTQENSLAVLSRNSKLMSVFMLRLICLALISSLLTLSPAMGQDARKDGPDKNQIVTASVSTDGVRISAPSELVQLRLQVYDEAGQKLFDTEQRGGNVLDWHVRNSSGERVADGTYLWVVTVKGLSGRISQKLGLASVNGQSITLRSATVSELNVQQAQAVGPLDNVDEEVAVKSAEDSQPVAALAHTGEEAELARTRGALSFRVGDLFSANDKEQMRLTEDGRLGIGISDPQATLDVAGAIRATKGIEFSDGTVLTSTGRAGRLKADGVVTEAATGTGSQDRIAKWVDNAGTLADSGITESAGNIGIGTSTPTQALEVANGRVLTTGSQTLTAPGAVLEIATTVTNNNSNASGFRMRNIFNGNATFQQGLDVAPTFAPTANISLARGFISTAFFAPPAGVTITEAFGGNANTVYNNTSGAVSSGAGFAVRSPIVLGALKPIFQFGMRINNQGIAGTQTSYGLFVDAQSGSSNNYSAVFAGGNVGIGTNNPTSKLQVAGTVESTSGGFKFPDGSVQTSAVVNSGFGKTYTHSLNTEVELVRGFSSLLQLNLPAGTYLINATVEFENRANAIFQDNSRFVQCAWVNPFGAIVHPHFRLGGADGPMDKLPITVHTITTRPVDSTLGLNCYVAYPGDRSFLFATERRLTAIKLVDVVTQ